MNRSRLGKIKPFQAAAVHHVIAWILGQKLDIGHGKHGHHVEFCTANKSRARFGFYLNMSGIYVDQSTLSPFILISEVQTSTRPRPKLFPLQQKHQLYPEICCWSYSIIQYPLYKTLKNHVFPDVSLRKWLGFLGVWHLRTPERFTRQELTPKKLIEDLVQDECRLKVLEPFGVRILGFWPADDCIDLPIDLPMIKQGECIQRTRWGNFTLDHPGSVEKWGLPGVTWRLVTVVLLI